MKRVFGIFEVVFDICYLVGAGILGMVLLVGGTQNSTRTLAGIMALVLACGDAFHLVPRIRVILTREEERLRPALGRGKQITSITMTVFYLLLWQIGRMIAGVHGIGFWDWMVCFLAVIRIVLCVLPQNKWTHRYPPVRFGIWRNVPFFALGAIVAVFFFLQRSAVGGMGAIWLAIVLSFAFYLPVVFWSNKNPKIGMLMLPKTCAYLWILIMCLSL